MTITGKSLIIGLALLFSGAVPSSYSSTGFEISPAELQIALGTHSKALVIVDLREPELYQEGHIPGAINLPWPVSTLTVTTTLDRNADIVLVCHGGPMGKELTQVMAGLGYRSVRNLIGGMHTWRGAMTGRS